MRLLLALILGIVWILGFVVFHVASWGLHVLLLVALVSVVLYFVRGRGMRHVDLSDAASPSSRIRFAA
jgi:hypothetical protein